MTLNTVLIFAGIVFVIAIIPGPNALLVLFTALTKSRVHAFINILGVSAGFLVHAFISAQGLSLILAQSDWAFMIMKWLGVGYLIYLGISHVRAGQSLQANLSQQAQYQDQQVHCEQEYMQQDQSSEARTGLNEGGGYFIKGFLTNMLNPKIVLFYVSIFPQFVSHKQVLVDSMVLGMTQALVVSSWFLLVILLAEQFKAFLTNANNAKWLNYLSASTFFGFSAKLATTKL